VSDRRINSNSRLAECLDEVAPKLSYGRTLDNTLGGALRGFRLSRASALRATHGIEWCRVLARGLFVRKGVRALNDRRAEL